MFENQNEINRALVALTLETILLEIGKATYDKVIELLNKNYHCYLPDCYDHPEYLRVILKDLFGASSYTIVERVRDQLKEVIHHEQIAKFIEVISK